jgi:hypothetical protein
MTMTWTKWACLGVAAAAVSLAVGVGSASCAQTPTTVPIRTFELAQRVDVVCMQVNDPVTGIVLPTPVPVQEDNCAPVAAGINGGPLPFHLFAAVTQLARGELAIVDLTAGYVVDQDRTTPGIQFIPVGAIPTDVTVMAPDPQMTFVSSADPNKPAIYGIPNVRLLGDTLSPQLPLAITDLLSCALPQPPQGLVATQLANGQYVLLAMLRATGAASSKIVAIDPAPLLAGAGLSAGDAGAASGDAAGAGSDAAGAGAGDAGAGPGDAGTGDGGVVAVVPGSLAPCSILGATELASSLPSTWTPGPAWPDGVPYVDGGVDLTDAEPPPGPTCSGGFTAIGSAFDGGLPVPVAPAAAPRPYAMAVRNDANAHLLYVTDQGLPVIHVIDLADPTSPREAPPLLATSLVDPQRQVAVGAIALSPPTRDYRRFLYAVDANVGTVMVFEVTDPASTARQPLLRPHPELNPFVAPDRIAFSAPVATLSFVQHDWPLPSQLQGSSPVNNYQGLLCNPNPNAHPDPNTFNAYGAYYRPDQATVIQSSATVLSFPDRLRGVFAFVTLSNGTIVVIDVDDWDAPCRRPDPMTADTALAGVSTSPDAGLDGGAGAQIAFGVTGSLEVPEPAATDTNDLDPYHAPYTYTFNGAQATTDEAFYPVSVPNRMRSNFLLRNDPSSGQHVPNLIAPTLLFDLNGAPLPTGAGPGAVNPLLLPTPLPAGWVDPTYFQNPSNPDPSQRAPTTAELANATAQAGSPVVLLPGSATSAPPGPRLSYDDPTSHIDQDWTVTYEGAIPTVNGLAMDVASYDDYRTLTLASSYAPPGAGPPDASIAGPSPAFCARGIEDWSLGQQHANAVLATIAAAPELPPPPKNPNGGFTLPQWTSDYVELADDLLPATDPYWAVSSSQNDCWDPPLDDDSKPQARHDACFAQFDAASNADTHYGRDFPILEAYDDHLVLGRFGWLPQDAKGNPVSEQPNNRVVVGADDSNKPFLRFARCCFHHLATFKVRTGGQWVINGSTTGYLHHIVTDPATNRCVPSCRQVDVLRNARTFGIPWGDPGTVDAPKTCQPPSAIPAGLDRNSVLAMRNPMFSFIVWSGCAPLQANDVTETARDMQWRFSLRGGFSPLTLSLTGGTTTAVSPQSMRFIDSLGQLAVVDGSAQGLVLIDLNSLAFAHNPYF